MRTLLTELNVESSAYAASFILTVDPAVADPKDVITNDLSSGLFLTFTSLAEFTSLYPDPESKKIAYPEIGHPPFEEGGLHDIEILLRVTESIEGALKLVGATHAYVVKTVDGSLSPLNVTTVT